MDKEVVSALMDVLPVFVVALIGVLLNVITPLFVVLISFLVVSFDTIATVVPALVKGLPLSVVLPVPTLEVVVLV